MNQRPLASTVLGVFFVVYLAANASVLGGAESFERVAGVLHRSSLLPVLELVLLGVLGWLVARRWRETPSLSSRLAAVGTFAFFFVHFLELGAPRLFLGAGPEATYTVLTAHLSYARFGVPWAALLYVAGLVATGFQFASGVLARVPGRRGLAVGLGGALVLLGFSTVLSFATGTQLFGGGAAASADAIPCGSSVPMASSRP